MGIAIRKVLALKAQAKERYTKGFAISRCKALFKGMFTRRRHPEVCAVARGRNNVLVLTVWAAGGGRYSLDARRQAPRG